MPNERGLLEDPQQLNSYSYARNNPLRYNDPTGQGINEILASIQAQINSIQTRINMLKAQIESAQLAAGGAVEDYSQGSGVLNKVTNQLTKNNTAAYIAGGIGIAAGGGAVLLYYGIPAALSATPTAIPAVTKACEKYCPKLVNPGINVTSEKGAQQLQHVIDKHTIGGFNTAGNSVFNAGENVVQLIRSGTQQVITKQRFGPNFQRIFDVGRNIGVDRATGGQTSVMTIIRDKAGNLITSFPGIP
jgi:hypothetical protein